MQSGEIVAVHVGRVAPLGRSGVASGFVKRAVAGPVAAGRLGLAGDEQADLRVHGGVDKAVYCYPTEGYAEWRAEFPEHETAFVAGGLGENIATRHLSERTVAIGDVVRIGGALVQVTQSRQPCVKLAQAFDDPRLAKAMMRSGRCGWYLRVIEPGTMAAGDAVVTLERPNPGWTVARFAALVAAKRLDVEVLTEMVAMPGLAEHWQLRALGLLAQLKRDAGVLG